MRQVSIRKSVVLTGCLGLVVLVAGWLLGFTRPGTLTLSWFIVACDTTTIGCLAVVVVLSLQDAILREDARSLPIAGVAATGAVLWLAHLILFPGDLPALTGVGWMSNATSWLFLLINLWLPIALGITVVFKPRLNGIQLAALLGRIGWASLGSGLALVALGILLGLSPLQAVTSSGTFPGVVWVLGGLAVLPAAAAIALVLSRGGPSDDRLLAATLAALTLALATSLSIVFLPGRYSAPWYADHLLALGPYVCLLIGALGYQRDVIAAERALSRRLRAIFDSGAIGVGLVDQEGRLVEVNQRLADFLWRPPSALVGQRLEELIIPGESTATADRMDAAGATPNTRRERFQLPDARLVWGELSLSPVQGLGPTSLLMALVRDVDDEVKAEQQLLVLQEREASELRELVQRATEAEAVKGEFLRLVSHELRGPTAALLGYISLLRDGDFGSVAERAAPALEVLWAKSEQISLLVELMLDTARLEDQQLELEMGDHDLRELVDAAIESMRPLLGAEHHLEMKVPAELVRVRGDRIRTTAIVANLIGNAIKYSPAGGPVQVEVLAAASGPASVRVKDEGLGIDAGDQARLFSRFGRIVTGDNSHIPGSGLGLYLAQRLARLQGGDLVLEESKPGFGSSFRLDLVYVGTSSPGRES